MAGSDNDTNYSEYWGHSKYRPEYCERIVEFFSAEPFEFAKDKEGSILTNNGKPIVIPAKYPTLERFATSLGVTIDTIFKWAKRHEEFMNAKSIAIQTQKDILMQNGLLGSYNATMSIFIAKSTHGMRDGNEQDQLEPQPLTITYGVVDARTRNRKTDSES